MIRRPPGSTRTDTLCPYTTLFRSIGARLGVLINAGGFAQNSRMRSRYMADGSTRWTAAGASDSGEMIEEMQRLGAAVAQMDGLLGSPMGIPPGAESSEERRGGKGCVRTGR